VNKLKHFI